MEEEMRALLRAEVMTRSDVEVCEEREWYHVTRVISANKLSEAEVLSSNEWARLVSGSDHLVTRKTLHDQRQLEERIAFLIGCAEFESQGRDVIKTREQMESVRILKEQWRLSHLVLAGTEGTSVRVEENEHVIRDAITHEWAALFDEVETQFSAGHALVVSLEVRRSQELVAALAETEKECQDAKWLSAHEERDARWAIDTHMAKEAQRIGDILLWRAENEEYSARCKVEAYERHDWSRMEVGLAAILQDIKRTTAAELSRTHEPPRASPMPMEVPQPLMSLHSPTRVGNLGKSDDSLATPQSSAPGYLSNDQPVTDPSKSLEWGLVSRSTDTVAHEDPPNSHEPVPVRESYDAPPTASEPREILSHQEVQDMWAGLDHLRSQLNQAKNE